MFQCVCVLNLCVSVYKLILKGVVDVEAVLWCCVLYFDVTTVVVTAAI